MRPGIINLLKRAEGPFNIIEEFAALSAARKMSICDRLFSEGREAFEGAAKLLWPQAGERDFKKLENFLILLKKAAH